MPCRERMHPVGSKFELHAIASRQRRTGSSATRTEFLARPLRTSGPRASARPRSNAFSPAALPTFHGDWRGDSGRQRWTAVLSFRGHVTLRRVRRQPPHAGICRIGKPSSGTPSRLRWPPMGGLPPGTGGECSVRRAWLGRGRSTPPCEPAYLSAPTILRTRALSPLASSKALTRPRRRAAGHLANQGGTDAYIPASRSASSRWSGLDNRWMGRLPFVEGG